MNIIPPEIPKEFEPYAIDLSHLGVKQVAWLRPAALRIIDGLGKTETAVLGGDVLKKDNHGFRHEYSNWHSDKRANEPWNSYAFRSRREAREYMMAYPDAEDGTVAYVLVLQNNDDANEASHGTALPRRH